MTAAPRGEATRRAAPGTRAPAALMAVGALLNLARLVMVLSSSSVPALRQHGPS